MLVFASAKVLPEKVFFVVEWNFRIKRGCMQAIDTHRGMRTCHHLRHVAECWQVLS